MKKCITLFLLIVLSVISVAAQKVGINTTLPLSTFHVDLGDSHSNGILFMGSEPSGGSFPSLGAGRRFMYFPGKGALRAGVVEGTHWDNALVGSNSAAFGFNTIARGAGSFATGDETNAKGFISSVFGSGTLAKGYCSMVVGMFNDSLLLGADQNAPTAITPLFIVGNGDGNSTRHNAMAVFKNGNLLLKNPATVMVDPGILVPPVVGPGTRIMWMPQKSAFRLGTVHNNDWDADSIGTWSTGIGYSTKAKGQFSLALGLQTTASGTTSTAIGFNTTASGENAISMGSVTTASGANSTSVGFKTHAGSYGSISIGRYNDTIVNSNSSSWIATDPMLILGNGTSDAALHNAMVVYKNGSMVLKNPTAVFSVPGVFTAPIEGPGTRMMWMPEKSALRIGTVGNSDWDADSIGTWSTGIGFETKAKGHFSLAMGVQTKAIGTTSTAMGYATEASGENSIAMGSVTTAGGANTTTMGFKTFAKSYGSVSLGRYNDKIISSNASAWVNADPLLIVGNGTSDAALHNTLVVYKNGNVVSKNPTTISIDPGVITTPIYGTGTRMMWLPEKSAFRLGTVTNTNWDADSLGTWSTGIGFNTKAKGPNSVALGSETTAAGISSTALGYNTKAMGENSISMGSISTASGVMSSAMGYSTMAIGDIATAMGNGTSASGTSSTAMGNGTSASGATSTALGYSTEASGENAISMGSISKATGPVSTAMGYDTRAAGFGSIARGRESRARGDYSDAAGVNNIAKGFASTVVGINNDSILLTNQTVINPTTPLFIVGNGDGTAAGQRKNAMVVRKDGHVGIGTNTPATFLHIELEDSASEGFLVTGDGNAFGTVPNLGAGNRLSYFPGKNAFRAGVVTGTQWDDINTGVSSVALGFNTKAKGLISTAIGNESSATGDYSTAIGLATHATGYFSMALGMNSTASGANSTTMGYQNTSSGNHASTLGNNNIAKGYSSTVVGMYNDSLLAASQTTIANTTPLLIVGNGSDNESRNNALVVYKNGNVDIDGYTRLGDSTETSNVPRIKMKKLTGTSAVTQNAWKNIAHGLTMSKILSVDIIMTIPGFVNLPPSYTYQPGYEYQFQVATSNIVVINSASNSSNILNKAFTILIVYEE